MPSQLYCRYHKLFKDEEHYDNAYEVFKERFMEDYSITAVLGQENTDNIFITLMDDPAMAKQQLKDYIAAKIPIEWEKHLACMEYDDDVL